MASYGIKAAVGEYDAVVQETQMVALGERGTPALRVYVVAQNERMEATIWLTEKAMGMARQALRALGFDPDQRDLSELDYNAEALRGNTCRIAVVEDDYGGKLRKKAEIVTGGGRKKVAPDRLASLTSALRAAASDESKEKAARPPAPTAPPPAKRSPAPPPPKDPYIDDIPF